MKAKEEQTVQDGKESLICTVVVLCSSGTLHVGVNLLQGEQERLAKDSSPPHQHCVLAVIGE